MQQKLKKTSGKSSENPLISVIIPGWNVERYWPQCLNIMSAQTYKNLEIICVDDGSADNSIKVLKDFQKKDRRIKIIPIKHGGLSMARNTGIKAAKGEYIHFMDSDDGINLDFYEKMVAGALDSGADIAAAGVITNNHSQTVSFPFRAALTDLSEKVKWTKCLKYGHVWRYLFRRDFLLKNKLFFVEGRYIEDLAFILPAVKAANFIATVPGAYYYYVKNRPGSILTMRHWKWKKKLNADLKWANEFRDRFMAENGLSKDLLDGDRMITKIKLFGLLPFGKTVKYMNRNVVVFYFLGIKLFRAKTAKR